MSLQGVVRIERLPLKVTSQRPFELQQVLVGKRPQQIHEFVGLAYSLCGQAQKFASALALFELTDIEKTQSHRCAGVEILKEHYVSLVQLFKAYGLLTPEQIGPLLTGVGHWVIETRTTSSPDAFVSVLQQVEAAFERLLGQKLSEFSLERKKGMPSVMTLLAEANVLPPMAQQMDSFYEQPQIMPMMLQASGWRNWVIQPGLGEQPLENSAFTRIKSVEPKLGVLEQTQPLMARVFARLLDVQRVLDELYRGLQTHSVSNSWMFGRLQSNETVLGWVETARGRLIHLVKHNRQDKGVQDYAICAPTEWNFHPKGVVQSWLSQLPKDGQWCHQARLIAQLIDPCVPIEMKGCQNA